MIQAIATVVKENVTNRRRMFRLALYELKAMNSGTVFGFLWNFFNPALQIFVYWFVFSVGLQTTAPRGGYPYIVWMVCGIIPWFFISGTLQSSATSIFAYSGVIKRMYIPLSIVPVKSVIAQFFSHMLGMVIVIAVFLLYGGRLTLGSLWLFYFMFCAVAFLLGFALFSSAITVLFKDFQKFLSPIIRLLFYISPVVWVQEKLPEKLQYILRLNPLAYLINGYRDSILYGDAFMRHWRHGIYFWVITLALFVLGCVVHMKFRKQFIDLM